MDARRHLLRLKHVAVALAVLTAALEPLWRVRYHMSSPLLGLGFVAAAILVGRLTETLACGRARGGVAEALVFGGTVLCALLLLVQGLKVPGAFVPLVVIACAGGARVGRIRLLLEREVPVSRLLFQAVVFGAVVVLCSFVDRLPITRLPTAFPWIDTPFWLANAHSVDAGLPVPDIHIQGGLLDYHYGASILPVVVRRLTGLPMHVAYLDVMILYAYLLAPILVATATTVLRPSRHVRDALGYAIPVVALGWFNEFIFNFPTVVAHVMLFHCVLLVARIRDRRALACLPPFFFVLMATKEVDYAFAFVLGAGVALHQWIVRRSWLHAVALAWTGAVTAPLYALLVRVNQRSHVELFREHLTSGWWTDESGVRWIWWVVTGFAIVAAVSLWRTWLAGAVTLLSAAATHIAGTAVLVFAKPVFDPPMNEHSTSWLLFDIRQFQHQGRDVLVLALLVTGFVHLAASWDRSQRRLAVAAIATLGLHHLRFNYWESPGPAVIVDASGQARILPGGPPLPPDFVDPIVELLEKIPPVGSLVMSNHLPHGGDNPHWGGFFGHRFYLLRTGRWASAQPRYAEMKRIQEDVYAATSADGAMEKARTEGVTHLIVDRQRPAPWTAGRRPHFENAAFALYVIE